MKSRLIRLMGANTSKNLLIQVERISAEASKCNLDFSKIKNTKAVTDIADFLSITYEQAVIFSCLLEVSLQRNITLENFAKHLNCSVLISISFISDIDVLEKKSLVKKKLRYARKIPSYSEISYIVPHNVIEALRTSDKNHLKPLTNIKFPSLLQQVREYVKEREDDSISTKQLLYEIEILLTNNPEHDFVKYINKSLEKTEHKCIALTLAFFRLSGQFMTELDFVAEIIYEDMGDQLDFRRTILNGNNELVKKGIVAVQPSDFSNHQILTFSKTALKIIFKQYPELVTEENTMEGLIKHSSIIQKPLYFNDALKQQIDEIIYVLGKSQFRRFQSIAKKNKQNAGITAIFYGHSGTGKTEIALQIAKKTRRDIFMVELSQLRSKWFGESEKQVKKIFDDYKELIQTTSDIPILFINEADGMFSRRMNIDSNSNGSIQTQNIIQNIILQELENFKGILLATTNLTGNLDSAFERRLLFKIDFPKPDASVRKMIWKSKLPELSLEKARLLGEKFELTGGQIDNQVRQLLLRKAMERNLNVFIALLDSCEKEQGFTQRKRIGY